MQRFKDLSIGLFFLFCSLLLYFAYHTINTTNDAIAKVSTQITSLIQSGDYSV